MKTFLNQMRRLFTKILFPLLCLIILISLVFALIPLSIWQYSYKDETREADVAIVLGAAVYTDKPSPVFMERIKHGLSLYKAGQVKKLLFTGGKDQYDKLSEAQTARQVALSEGIPEEDILLEELSTRTWQNLVNAVDVLEANNLETVLLVSDPLHMKRAMLMANDIGILAHPSPAKTTRYRSARVKWEFLKSETLYLAGYGVRKLSGLGGDWEREDAEKVLRLADEVEREVLGKQPPQ